MENILFETICYYFNRKIRTTIEYWQKIVNEKHPSIKEYEHNIVLTLQDPDEIRMSKRDENIFLYYKLFNDKYVCTIIKFLNDEGFIVTAYHTKKIKEGMLIWRK